MRLGSLQTKALACVACYGESGGVVDRAFFELPCGTVIAPYRRRSVDYAAMKKAGRGLLGLGLIERAERLDGDASHEDRVRVTAAGKAMLDPDIMREYQKLEDWRMS